MDVLVLDIDKVDKDPGHRSLVLDRAMRTRDMDNERFLRKVRERLDRCAAISSNAKNLDAQLALGLVASKRLLRAS